LISFYLKTQNIALISFRFTWFWSNCDKSSDKFQWYSWGKDDDQFYLFLWYGSQKGR